MALTFPTWGGLGGGLPSLATRGFDSLRRDVNRLFEDFWPTDDWSVNRPAGQVATTAWIPRSDVKEDDTQIQIYAELPGIPKENVNIDIQDNTLIISGEHTETKDDTDRRGYRLRERRYGHYERRFFLPSAADTGKIEAKMEDGVLHLVVPKTAESQAKRITVQ